MQQSQRASTYSKPFNVFAIKEPVFILLCSYRSMERSGHSLAYSLEVALAATNNGPGGIEKRTGQSGERESGWTPCLEK